MPNKWIFTAERLQHKKRQNIKRRRYYQSDSSDYGAESIEDNYRGYGKRKKKPTKKININAYDDDDDVDDDDDQRKIEEKSKKRKKKKGIMTHKTMNLVNFSIQNKN